MFSQKTTYLKAREEICKTFVKTFPPEVASCTPVYMYFLGRHTIRFPMDHEVIKFADMLPSLRDKLLASGKLAPEVANEFKNWQLLMHPTEAARVTMSGKYETGVLGKLKHSLEC